MASGAKTLPTLLKNLQGKHHAHGCADCGARYTDACTATDVDGRCQNCRGSKIGRPLWDTNSDPVLCCYSFSRECDIHTRGVYDLAGTRTWYRCSVCSRTHPFLPTRKLEEAPND